MIPFNKILKLSAFAVGFVALIITIQVFPLRSANAQLTTITYGPLSASNGQTSTNGIYNWTAPAGVTSINVKMWGAGGNGGGVDVAIPKSGNGGSGGALLIADMAVIPSQTYKLYVGRPIEPGPATPFEIVCNDPLSGVLMVLRTHSLMTNATETCPFVNDTFYLEVNGGYTGSPDGGGTTNIAPWRADGLNPYYAVGASNVFHYAGGGGGDGRIFGAMECADGGGGGGAGGGGIGGIGILGNDGENGQGLATLGGGAGGHMTTPGMSPGGGGGGSCALDNYHFPGGDGRIVIQYNTTSYVDVLRFKTPTGTVHIAGSTDLSLSPLHVAKGGVIYSVVLVPVADANASPVRIKTPGGILSLRTCTLANGCAFTP